MTCGDLVAAAVDVALALGARGQDVWLIAAMLYDPWLLWKRARGS